MTTPEHHPQDPTEPALRQPWLHDLTITVDGNSTQVSSAGGDIERATAQGFYVDDVRLLDRVVGPGRR